MGRRVISEEQGDAREPDSPKPRRKGRSHGGAAPLPDKVRSLGYPATNSPRGKAQAGKSPLRHQEKPDGSRREMTPVFILES